MHTFALVGSGSMAGSLGPALVRAGLRAVGVVARNPVTGDALAAKLETHLTSDVAPADLTCLCVPDAAVGKVAAGLDRGVSDWSGRLVLHTSGALTADELAPLAKRGARTLAFHPVQTFPPDAGPERFDGIWVTLQGNEEATTSGEALARRLGAHAVRIDAEQKAAVHLAATVLSNYTVTLAGIAQSIVARSGIPESVAAQLLQPLLDGTARSLDGHTPGNALTGPIARGDMGTVKAHLDTLEALAPQWITAYVLMATETTWMARSAGRLSVEESETLLDALSVALESVRKEPMR